MASKEGLVGNRRRHHACRRGGPGTCRDRKSTRLNSSHLVISYAVFCLKKKTRPHHVHPTQLKTSIICPILRHTHRRIPVGGGIIGLPPARRMHQTATFTTTVSHSTALL